LVEHGLGTAAVDDGAERELGLHGRADFAHEHEVERRIEGSGDLCCHRHTTARQGKHHRILVLEAEQSFGEALPGLLPVPEQGSSHEHQVGPPPSASKR
jgi:hypothetical protein